MRMRQKMTQAQKQTPALILDILDMQSVCLGAESTAKSLIKEHRSDIKKIEAAILKVEVLSEIAGIKDFNFREEILWNVRWLLLGRC